MCGADKVTVDDRQIQTARHAYYAAISYVDERIGQILAALHGAGLAGDTIVIFTADHGEMLGERGLWYKMSFFEPSARVPLIISTPGAQGCRRVADPVSLLDLAPTLTELAGTAADTGLDSARLDGTGPAAARSDGISLQPCLSGQQLTASPWRRPRPVVAEYLAEGVTTPAVMLRSARHKLVVCDGDPDQLYDLACDPLEQVNLAAAPDQAASVRDLRAYLTAHWDLAGLRERVLASQRDRRLIGQAMSRGTYASWDYQPSVNDALRYVRSRADLYQLQKNARLDSAGAVPNGPRQ
jgi:choline-sulfatase